MFHPERIRRCCQFKKVVTRISSSDVSPTVYLDYAIGRGKHLDAQGRNYLDAHVTQGAVANTPHFTDLDQAVEIVRLAHGHEENGLTVPMNSCGRVGPGRGNKRVFTSQTVHETL